jgi:serine protease Do
MNPIRWYGPTLAVLATGVMILVAGPTMVQRIATAQTETKLAVIRSDLTNNDTLNQLSSSFRKVGEIVEPSVVSIEVSAKASTLREKGNSYEDEMFRRFYGPQGPQGRGRGQGQQQDPNLDQYNPQRRFGSGSGWVYDNKGHIITNNHVVDGAEEIKVKFADGSERKATIVGTDPRSDVAVIKVSPDNLHPAALAKEPVEQGDIVFAFGSPMSFEFSMSQGIVSAKGRKLRIIAGGQGYEQFIQTDAAINPGNSGGPLTNIRGEVVGMNSAIATRTGGSDGLGFAIPVDMVTDVVKQIISQGKVVRGYLGVFIEDLDEETAKTFGFKGKGVLVVEPIEGGPADKAGLKPEDIITKVDGKAVKTADELRFTIAGFAPKSKVPLEVIRDGKTITVQLEVGELAEQLVAGTGKPSAGGLAPKPGKAPEALTKLGIEAVETFTETIAQQAQIEFSPGVMIRDVRPESIAQVEGLGRFVIITRVNGTAIKNVEEFYALVAKLDPVSGIRLLVKQDGRTRVVTLKLPG